MNINKIFTKLENKNRIRSLLNNDRYIDILASLKNSSETLLKKNGIHYTNQEVIKNIDKIKQKYGYPDCSSPINAYQKIIQLKQKYFQENPKKLKYKIDNSPEKFTLITHRPKTDLLGGVNNNYYFNDSYNNARKESQLTDTKRRKTNYRVIKENDLNINFPYCSSKNTSSTTIYSNSRNKKNFINSYNNNIYNKTSNKIEKIDDKINTRNNKNYSSNENNNNAKITPATFVNLIKTAKNKSKRKIVDSFRFLKNTRQEYVEVDNTLKKLLNDENFNLRKKKGFTSIYPISKRIKMLSNARNDINKMNKTTRKKSIDASSFMRDSYNSELNTIRKELKNKNKSESIFDAIFSDDNDNGDNEEYNLCRPVLIKSGPKPKLQVPNYPDFCSFDNE